MEVDDSYALTLAIFNGENGSDFDDSIADILDVQDV